MKSVTATLAIAASALAVMSGTAAAKPSEDLVSGARKGLEPTIFVMFFSQSHVGAKGGPLDARGHMWARFFDTQVGFVLIKATVVCVNVDGNQATVGAIVDQSNAVVVSPGSGILRKVIDNGSGRNDRPDEIGVGFYAPGTPCPPPALTPITMGAVDQGNFVVKDRG